MLFLKTSIECTNNFKQQSNISNVYDNNRFQEATAQRILHTFKDMGHRRVLLADEVGLGKTMVAKELSTW